jgi:Ras-related protein Rab-2A
MLLYIAVGKSNILSRFTFGKFNPDHEITIGCEFLTKNMSVKDRNIRIQIWDTAGQEAFRSITRAYYKNSTCAFIVYDISERKTFDNVKSWLNECKDICYKDILICLIGNKCDLDTKRVVSSEEGQKFAEENNLLFFETSAKDGTNIQEVFVETVTIIVEKIERGQINLDMTNNGIKIGKYPKTKNQDNQVNKAKDKNNCC